MSPSIVLASHEPTPERISSAAAAAATDALPGLRLLPPGLLRPCRREPTARAGQVVLRADDHPGRAAAVGGGLHRSILRDDEQPHVPAADGEGRPRRSSEGPE